MLLLDGQGHQNQYHNPARAKSKVYQADIRLNTKAYILKDIGAWSLFVPCECLCHKKLDMLKWRDTNTC